MLRGHETVTADLPVTPGLGLEVCLAQWWASSGACDVAVRVEFFGLDVRGSCSFSAVDFGGAGRLDLRCIAGKVTLQPKVEYTHVRRALFPTTAGRVRVTKDVRNTRMNGAQMFALDLSYSFSLQDKV